jgi:signal transduction histidine kinase
MPNSPATTSIDRSSHQVRHVLTFAGTALLLTFGALVATSVVETRRVAASLETIRSELRPRAEAAYEMEINLLEVSDALFAFLADLDTASLRTLEAERLELQRAVDTFVSLDKRSPEETTARRLRALMSAYDSMSVSLTRGVRNADSGAEAAAAARARYGQLRSRIAAWLDAEIQPAAIAEWHLEADRVLALSRRQRAVHVYVAVLGTVVVLLSGLLAFRTHRAVDEARALAELASRQKSEFASITAHELRSPLNAIIGSLELMQSGRAGQLPADGQRYTDMASRNSRRLMALVDELLALDKMEAGMLPMTREPVNLSNVVHQACAELEATAAQNDISVRTELSSTRLVTGDPGRLGQVVTNLVSNALKHAPSASEVVARVEDLDRLVRVTIRDHGPGITGTDSERIFQRFVQTGPAKQHSTGLGLTIAREIVHRHNGRIGVISELGKGATFWFELPAHS